MGAQRFFALFAAVHAALTPPFVDVALVRSLRPSPRICPDLVRKSASLARPFFLFSTSAIACPTFTRHKQLRPSTLPSTSRPPSHPRPR